MSDGMHLQQAPPQVTKCKVRKFQFHLNRHSSELKARHIQFPQRFLVINLSLFQRRDPNSEGSQINS